MLLVVRPDCLYRRFSGSLPLPCFISFLVSTAERLHGEGQRGTCSSRDLTVNTKPIEVSGLNDLGDVRTPVPRWPSPLCVSPTNTTTPQSTPARRIRRR